MDPITVVVTAVRLGAEAGLRAAAAQAVEDAYAVLKALLTRRDVDVSGVERRPDSATKQESLREDLTELNGTPEQVDEQLLAAAQQVIAAVMAHEPQAGAAIGIDLDELRVASLRISGVSSTGAGVRGQKWTIDGDAVFENIHAGPAHPVGSSGPFDAVGQPAPAAPPIGIASSSGAVPAVTVHLSNSSVGRDLKAIVSVPGQSRRSAPPVLEVLADPEKDAGFLGRSTELSSLLALLAPPGGGNRQDGGPRPTGVRSVVVSALAGAPGVGKTALAEAAARAVAGRGWFPGGVLMVNLHGYDPDPDEVVWPARLLRAVLRRLGLPEDQVPPEEIEQATVYHQLLDARAETGQRVLIVLDNVADARQVKDLLPRPGSSHRMVITSRETLAGLPGTRQVDIDVLGEADAAALLASQLEHFHPGDARLTAAPDAAATLVACCGGLPLAVVVVAALLAEEPDLTVGELAGELADEGARLRALNYGEWAVGAAIEASHHRLPASVAELFRLLAAAPGTETSLSVAAVVADQTEAEVHDDLRRLCRAHLAQRVPTQDGLPVRWRMHDLIRRYAWEQLTDQQRVDGFTRVLDHYRRTTSLACRRFMALPGEDVPAGFGTSAEALGWVVGERAGLIATVVQAATSHSAAAVELAAELGPMLERARLHADWLTAVTATTDVADQLPDPNLAAKAWTGLGLALMDARRFDDALEAHQRAQKLLRKVGDRRGDALAWNNLGNVLHELRRFDEALNAHQRSREIHEEIGDWHGVGWAWNHLGGTLQDLQRFAEAIAAHQQAGRIFQTLGDRHSEARTLINLGNALREVGRLDEAIEAHRCARRIFQALGDRHAEARARNSLGVALMMAGCVPEAIAAFKRAIMIFQELRDEHGEGRAWTNLGGALHQAGHLEEAIAACQRDIMICAELDDHYGQAQTLTNLGDVYTAAGQTEKAHPAWTSALELFDRLGAKAEADKVRRRLRHAEPVATAPRRHPA